MFELRLIIEYLTICDIQLLSITSSLILNEFNTMSQKNQQIKSGINSKNVKQISYLYKTMGRLHIYYILKCIQFTNEFNISNIKYNL